MVGTSIFQYQVVEKLGAGGMGEIYKARDSRLNRFVAIKVLASTHTGDDDRRRRFFQEAQAASALNHPNIITIYDIITDGPVECIVMEYVSGKTLAELTPNGGMPPASVVRLGVQMASALAAAHSAGIIHRDLKPGNVMVTAGSLVKVLDFGLAKLTESGFGESGDVTRTALTGPLTVEGSILGTVSYMSPEQAQGKRVDGRSDIFAFGAVLYEMATSRRAFEGENTLSTLTAVLRDTTPPVAETVPGIPPEFDQIIQRCLRKNPDERYQTMGEVESALAALKQRYDSDSSYRAPELPRSVIEKAAPIVPPQAPSVQTSPIRTQDPAHPAAPPPRPPTAGKKRLIGWLIAAALTLAVAAGIMLAVAAGGGWLLLKEKLGLAPPPQSSAQNSSSQPANSQPVPATSAPQTPAETSASGNKSLPPKPSSGKTADANPSEMKPTEPKPPEPPPPATGVPAPPNTESSNHTVSLPDGTPFAVTLEDNIPADADEGLTLHFAATSDLKMNGVVVIAKGAPVTGAVVEAKKKKMLGIGGKMTFRFLTAQSADGKIINVRATSARRADGPARRQVEVPGSSRSKEFAAAKGAQYLAFVDGDVGVTVKQ